MHMTETLVVYTENRHGKLLCHPSLPSVLCTDEPQQGRTAGCGYTGVAGWFGVISSDYKFTISRL